MLPEAGKFGGNWREARRHYAHQTGVELPGDEDEFVADRFEFDDLTYGVMKTYATEMQGVVVRSNRTRDYFVTREEAAAVLKACPDEQWKLLFALSRFGGCRCPSEHLALRWGDVDFAAGKITVHSSKTEHHEGKGIRVVPLFPELRPHLEAVRNELVSDPDFDPKNTPISKLPVISRYRDSNINLRTQLCKIIRRAGLTPWPKLFQNLRATRATELADQFPTHVAADWLGHSTMIADKHYRQTTADHFARALHHALQSPTEADESDGNERIDESETSLDVQKTRVLLTARVGDTGLERIADSSGRMRRCAGSLAPACAFRR